ncbi:hypothetical protein [Xanthomonas fragariae]|uniref:hypothetical protein n=1 Tax=Xanthomonas fragariae TaxID=48664 RepID=UPI001ABDF6FF|nr:hypothetical protein [Xanthomonas fragariae]UKR54292.1 hypothetical protein K4A87_04710 [Xanthomonas fragariae]
MINIDRRLVILCGTEIAGSRQMRVYIHGLALAGNSQHIKPNSSGIAKIAKSISSKPFASDFLQSLMTICVPKR